MYADGYVPREIDFMVVEQHPTLLNVTLHPAKVGHGYKLKNQTWYRRRLRPPPHSLWRESAHSTGDGSSININGGGDIGGGDSVNSGDGVALIGSGGDRGEIGHIDGETGGDISLTEYDIKGQDSQRIQPQLPVEPYTYYSPGHHEITDSPYHNTNDNALHIRVVHYSSENRRKSIGNGATHSLIQTLYFAAPLISFRILS